MRIEIISAVEFDTAKERDRLSTAFEGAQRELLLSILERFEQGQFEALAKEAPTWPQGLAEFLHPVVYDVVKDTLQRLAAAGTGQGGQLSGREQMLRDLAGVPTVRGRYPQHRIVVAPDGREVFHNPNDVRVQHNYALVVLLSTTVALRKSVALLEQCLATDKVSPQVGEFLARHEALLASAEKVEKQLLD